MIRVVIVDDEQPPRERIRSLLAAHPGGGFEIVAEAVDGSSAVDRITTLRPDLLFLDVQLPGLDGLEILDALGDEVPPAVVFVTAYDQHAIQAFDRHAVDYVLKPIVPARFAKAVDRACARLAGVAPNPEVARLLAERALQPGRSRRFACRVGGKVRLVSAEEVLWFEGAGNYVRLHTALDRMPIRATIRDLETSLDPTRFQRIHRSTIVRLDAIRRIEAEGDGEYRIALSNGAELRSSRRYGTAVRALIRPQ